MIIMAFDTETTGIPQWALPSDDPAQPHLVSLAFILHNTDDGSTLQEQHWIVRPDGWTIPDEVAAIHGITTEYAEEQGVPLEDAMNELMTNLERADARVAYGAAFDTRILRIALLRMGWTKEHIEGFFAINPVQCALTAATPLCRLPPTDAMMATGRRSGFKSPKLAEAYDVLCGKIIEGAHSALVDTRAALEVWLEIQARTTNPETF